MSLVIRKPALLHAKRKDVDEHVHPLSLVCALIVRSLGLSWYFINQSLSFCSHLKLSSSTEFFIVGCLGDNVFRTWVIKSQFMASMGIVCSVKTLHVNYKFHRLNGSYQTYTSSTTGFELIWDKSIVFILVPWTEVLKHYLDQIVMKIQ